MSYVRKTKDVYFILETYMCNGWRPLPFRFDSEKDRDKKLHELEKRSEESRKNPMLNPFSQFSRYKKGKKRVKLL